MCTCEATSIGGADDLVRYPASAFHQGINPLFFLGHLSGMSLVVFRHATGGSPPTPKGLASTTQLMFFLPLHYSNWIGPVSDVVFILQNPQNRGLMSLRPGRYAQGPIRGWPMSWAPHDHRGTAILLFNAYLVAEPLPYSLESRSDIHTLPFYNFRSCVANII